MTRKQMDRRDVLRLGLGGLAAVGVWGAKPWEGEAAAEDFAFLCVNDIHYFDANCGPWLERAMKQMKSHAEQPEFCLIVGDLADEGKPDQLGAARDLFRSLG